MKCTRITSGSRPKFLRFQKRRDNGVIKILLFENVSFCSYSIVFCVCDYFITVIFLFGNYHIDCIFWIFYRMLFTIDPYNINNFATIRAISVAGHLISNVQQSLANFTTRQMYYFIVHFRLHWRVWDLSLPKRKLSFLLET